MINFLFRTLVLGILLILLTSSANNTAPKLNAGTLLPVACNIVNVAVDSGDDDATANNVGNAKLLLGSDDFVGVRFEGITIPSGATVTNAYIEFVSAGNKSNNPSSVDIFGQNTALPDDFDPDATISNRPTTNQTVSWDFGAWTTDATYRSPDLSQIITELISQHGPYNDGTMAFIFQPQGSEVREAKSYDDNPSSAPVLVIEYNLPNTISGTVFEDQDGSQTQNGAEGGLSGIAVQLYQDNDQSQSLTTGDNLIGGATSATDGSYSFSLNNVYGGCADQRTAVSANDARDGNEGEANVALGKDRTVGLRFENISIPAGAIINDAYLELVAQSNGSNTVSSIDIYGENTATPQDYLANDQVSTRTRTTQSEPWTFGSWAVDVSYQSPDITSIIQELILDHGTYSSGTMAFILDPTGSQERKAYTADESAGVSPRLVINYSIPGSNDYVIVTQTNSFPVGGNLTTDNLEIASFTAAGQSDANNDFGITLCGPTLTQALESDCIDNGTSDPADDYFTIALLANDNAGNPAAKYQVVLDGVVLNPGGTDYGQAVILGNNQEFSADGASTYELIIQDFDDNTCQISYTTEVVFPCQIDLELTMQAEEQIVNVGEQVEYTIRLVNVGNNATATGIEVTEYLPASLSTPSGNATQGTYDPATGIWTVGDLGTAASAELVLTATVNASGFITSTAQVTEVNETDIDSTPNNDDGDQSEDDEASATTFDAAACADGSTSLNVRTQCDSQGSPQVTDDVYTVSINPGGTGTYDINGSYGGTNFTESGVAYGAPHSLSVSVPVGTALDLVITDAASGNCTYARVESTGSCSAIVTCYAMSDNSSAGVLYKYISSSNTWTKIGSTGRSGTEALAFDPFTNTLYTVFNDQLAIVDTLTASTTNIGTGIGTMFRDGVAESVDDVDGLTLDPNTGEIWASERSSGNDIVFKIDRTTGDFVPDAFGVGKDYIVVQEVFDPVNNQLVFDVDDIAIDPKTSDLYVISNQGGQGGVLTILNKTDGTVKEVIGNFGDVDDMEALAFYNNGALFGTTGNNGPDPADNNSLYSISKIDGELNLLAPIDPTGTDVDFEGCACLTGKPNFLTGTVYFDADESTTQNNSETGTTGITVELYLDKNADGLFTPGTDVLVNSVVTDANGDYEFEIASQGDYVVQVNESTLPPNSTLTTDNLETGSFFDLGITDANNDFGYAPASVDIALFKTVSDTLPAVGDVVTFTITVENEGTIDVTGITVEDIVPDGYLNVTNINRQGTQTGQTISWTIPTLAKLSSLQLTYEAEVANTGSYVNTAQVTAMDQTDEDSAPNNDDGDQSEDDETNATLTPRAIDLELFKTVSDTVAAAGSTVTFSVQVKNTGNADATGVAVEDYLPNGYGTPTSISNSGSHSAGVITWSGLTVAAGDSLSLSFETIIRPTGEHRNVAQVTATDQAASDPDSTPNNDDGDQSEDDEDFATVSVLQGIIGAAKTVAEIVNNEDGTFDLRYLLLVENFGVELYDLQLTDELTTEFGTLNATVAGVDNPGEYAMLAAPSVVQLTGGANVSVNAAFNGDGDQNLIQPVAGESMPDSSTVLLEFSIRFFPRTNKTSFQNQATAAGDLIEDGVSDGDTTDLSDDGGCIGASGNPTSGGSEPIPDPDIDCDGNPNEAGENDPTFFTVPPVDPCKAEAGTLGF